MNDQIVVPRLALLIFAMVAAYAAIVIWLLGDDVQRLSHEKRLIKGERDAALNLAYAALDHVTYDVPVIITPTRED